MNFASWIIAWPFKHIRFMLLLAVLAFIAYGIIQCNTKQTDSLPDYLKIPDYLKNIPSIKTDSRIYYMNDYTETEEGITLHGYYEFNGKKWVFVKSNLPLVRRNFAREFVISEN